MSVVSKSDILMALRSQEPILKRFGVRRYGLFGSFVREQQHEQSDIDLLIEFEPTQKTFDNFMNLSFFLEELLGRKVEVVTPEALSPHIGPSILREVEYATLSA